VWLRAGGTCGPASVSASAVPFSATCRSSALSERARHEQCVGRGRGNGYVLDVLATFTMPATRPVVAPYLCRLAAARSGQPRALDSTAQRSCNGARCMEATMAASVEPASRPVEDGLAQDLHQVGIQGGSAILTGGVPCVRARRKAERILRSREDAVDVVHALFADLIPRWSHDVDLPYLYRAITNRCLNVVRDRGTRARLLEREQQAATPVGRVASATGRRRRPDRALADRLDQSHMEVLVARFVDDMTQDEIATHLKVSRKTIGKRLTAFARGPRSARTCVMTAHACIGEPIRGSG
jgi:RNA polymerase sigma-70 factor (ECF subfamily)